MLHITDNVLFLRGLTGLSQQGFGQLFGMTKDMVYSYESGKAEPSVKMISDMADTLGVTVEKFAKVKFKREHFHAKEIAAVEAKVNARLKEAGSKVNTDYDESVKDKYISSLERENARIQKDLDLSLGEIRHNLLLGRALAETNQNLLIELLAKQRKVSVEDLSLEVGRENGERYQRMKEEGNFAYVGK